MLSLQEDPGDGTGFCRCGHHAIDRDFLYDHRGSYLGESLFLPMNHWGCDGCGA
jgi:hypothetical protein